MIEIIEAWIAKWTSITGLPPIFSDAVAVETPNSGLYAILTVGLAKPSEYYRGFRRDFHSVMVEIYSATGSKIESAGLAKLVSDSFDDPAKLTFDPDSGITHALTREVDAKEVPSTTRVDTRVSTLMFIVTTVRGR